MPGQTRTNRDLPSRVKLNDPGPASDSPPPADTVTQTASARLAAAARRCGPGEVLLVGEMPQADEAEGDCDRHLRPAGGRGRAGPGPRSGSVMNLT